jgi:hypothetical protein
LSDSESEKMYRYIEEIESYGDEAPVLADRLQALLVHLCITTAPKYQIKGVLRLGRDEYQAIAEIFYGSRVINKH